MKRYYNQTQPTNTQNATVMLLYGGGSIKKNGVYEAVTNALKDFDYIEFGGIPANPEYDILMDALTIIKAEKLIFYLL